MCIPIHIALPYCHSPNLGGLHDILQAVPHLVHTVLHLAPSQPIRPQSVIHSSSLQPPCQHTTYGCGGVGLLFEDCTCKLKFEQRRKIKFLRVARCYENCAAATPIFSHSNPQATLSARDDIEDRQAHCSHVLIIAL